MENEQNKKTLQNDLARKMNEYKKEQKKRKFQAQIVGFMLSFVILLGALIITTLINAFLNIEWLENVTNTGLLISNFIGIFLGIYNIYMGFKLKVSKQIKFTIIFLGGFFCLIGNAGIIYFEYFT